MSDGETLPSDAMSRGRPDPDYDRHGGFPVFEAAEPGPGFAPFVTSMRRLQDLAVSTDPDSDTWEDAADRAAELVALLEPYQAAEGVGPARPDAVACPAGQPADAAVSR